MDPSLYKELLVQRGLIYRYYWSPPAQGKPTLLFLHGFPSTAYDWHKQVAYFQPLGYGVLAPDLLGAGGTAKPLEAETFRMNAMARDIMDVLAAEGIDKVVGISHDWGSALHSRLCVLYPDAFLAHGWLAVAFLEPVTTHFDLEQELARTKEVLGYEAFAYWEFLLRDDASSVVQKHVDSFLQVAYSEDAENWRTYLVQRGKFAECVDGNLQLGRPSYLDDQEYAALRAALLVNGIQSSVNWYRAQVENVNLADSLGIPKKTWTIKAPSIVFLALKDYVCTPQAAKATMEKYGTEVTKYSVESGHWPHLQCADEVNDALHEWLESHGW
ncbi:Bifunctional epoxide hydrolase 2 [Trametes pubescens]|uniref:Bifunctional epoxide hydrolase 2 n=1 Tax=Trametes pubescens TaxID=154538 RepID=A0A1M2VTZ0_TRAPU|nr:Bifunctional epoxide hydrolase 2 [Trametes pubescens]